MPGKTPRNEEGQPPTRTPKETAKRLAEKAKDQKGGANKRRTEARAAGKASEATPMTNRMKKKSA